MAHARRLKTLTALRSRLAVAHVRDRTAAALVHRALRDDIIAMRIAPGEPINEKSLALRHGVSRTPVREALLRLAGERLVEIFPQSGTFVAPIPLAMLPEAILVRKALESVTVRAATEQADAASIAALKSLIDGQRELERRGDRDRFHAADDAFHAVIADVAGHPGIWQLIEQVKVQVDRFRRLTLPVPGRMGRVVEEHAAVVAAMAAGSADQAVAAMDAHLDGLSASIADVHDINPNYFELAPPGSRRPKGLLGGAPDERA
jgi:GntR family transcriptional regulator, rspAB operon transcriptional repressor